MAFTLKMPDENFLTIVRLLLKRMIGVSFNAFY